MRSLATGIEAYNVDNNAFPKCNQNNCSCQLVTDPTGNGTQYWVLENLSTPVAYMTSGCLPDPFSAKQRSGTPNPQTGASTPSDIQGSEMHQESFFKYVSTCEPGGASVTALTSNVALKAKAFWCLWSSGPSLMKPQVAGTGLLSSAALPPAVSSWIYDATNGSASRGGVFRIGGTGLHQPDPGGVFFETVSVQAK
jgi:hypothetical protein